VLAVWVVPLLNRLGRSFHSASIERDQVSGSCQSPKMRAWQEIGDMVVLTMLYMLIRRTASFLREVPSCCSFQLLTTTTCCSAVFFR